MHVFSSFSRLSSRIKCKLPFRQMSDHKQFPLEPSRYQWNKFKDYLHFYTLLGAIPCGIGLTCVNVFVGPATLSEIPEDYVPKHWEYIRHPVSRFIAKYILPSPQQEYEKYLAFIFIEHEKTKLRKLEQDIKDKIKERQDYQIFYYRPVMGKYTRRNREAMDDLSKLDGD